MSGRPERSDGEAHGSWWRGSLPAASFDRPQEILRFQAGHEVELFDAGRVATEAMLAAIDSALDHIHLETYILRADATGKRLLSHLEARARDGVQVRLILDAVGCYRLDRRALQSLQRAGGEVVEFNPPSHWLWRFRPRQRDHRKILIVDGRLAFLGGLNIGDEYVSEDPDGPRWRDAHLRLEGPAISELQALFVENWFRSGGSSFEWHSMIAGDVERRGNLSLAVLADGPSYRRRRLRDFFLDELARAQSHVLLVSPYFAPGPRVLRALEEASDRGVRVELLLAGYSDHPLFRRAARALTPRLVRRGVHVYEDASRMMHAKLAAFDGELAVIGTSNLDRQSLEHSCEVNVIFQSPAISKWILEHFGSHVLGARAIEVSDLEARRPWTRWVDRMAAFWSRL